MPTLLPELEPLAEELRKDEPNIVVVVGAGVSMGATSLPQASWDGLLEHGIKRAAEKEEYSSAWKEMMEDKVCDAFYPFDIDDALKCARRVTDALKVLSPQEYKDWLETAFGDFAIQDGKGKTLAALTKLQRAGALLLTTNYDGLLTEETRLPPVTPKDPVAFLEVINRDRRGILHIHGYWEDPDSVVLGEESYHEISEDSDLQDTFKSLWLRSSWLFVGCGNGLDDPNMGRLLKWGKEKKWEGGVKQDYFLAKASQADALASRDETPDYLKCVGYEEHADLPDILNFLAPTARLEYFRRVEEGLSLFRSQSSSEHIPAPSHQEYLDGEVPALEAEQEVQQRMRQHGWAFVFGVASVGKTTLALRIATSESNRQAFYLDLSDSVFVDADARGRAVAELRRLSQTDYLLILDNIHHRPEYAEKLWQQWHGQRSSKSRLLMVATKVQRFVATAPSQDLAFFKENHDTNSAVELRPTKEYLGRVMQHLYRRFGIRGPAPNPPSEVLRDWYNNYGRALSAFCVAVLGRLNELKGGNWGLPPEAASDWVQKEWLDKLDAANRKNLLSIAAFSVPELELQVPQEALPHPNKTRQLSRLVERTERGQFGLYRSFSLRNSGWARLILSAQSSFAEGEDALEEKVLYETAARDPVLAASLVVRWDRQDQKSEALWETVKRDTDGFAERALKMPLNYVASLLEAAEKQYWETESLWEAIEQNPDRFAECALRTQLDYVALFLKTARRRGRDVEPLWKAIDLNSDGTISRVLDMELHYLAGFLRTAKDHGRNVEPLWEAIEDNSDKLVERALQTQTDHLTALLTAARQQRQDVEPLWEAVEKSADRFIRRAIEGPTAIPQITGFLKIAERHDQDVKSVWKAINANPDKFVECALEASLDGVAGFLRIAQDYGQGVVPLWKAIEDSSGEFAERALEAPLNQTAAFIKSAKEHGQDVEPLWEAVEENPDKFVERALEAPLNRVAGFLMSAKQHGQDIKPLWEAIEHHSDELIVQARVRLHNVTALLSATMRSGRDPRPVWEVIRRESGKLMERALERRESLSQIAGFIKRAMKCWGDVDPLWEIIESQPENVSAMAQKSDVAELAGFLRLAPTTVTKAALADFQADHWDDLPDRASMSGAHLVASACKKADREDLKSALIKILIRRANPRDFQADKGSLANIAWLLKNAPPMDDASVNQVLDVLCKKEWLRPHFEQASCSSLARGFRMIALHQPPDVCRRFLDDSLSLRLQNELRGFDRARQAKQRNVVELIGSVSLCGWDVDAEHFEDVSLRKIGALPIKNYNPNLTQLGKRRFQFWIGLQVIALKVEESFGVPSPHMSRIINQALRLWRENIKDISQETESTMGRVSQGMVAWLEECSRTKQGLLPADTAITPTFQRG